MSKVCQSCGMPLKKDVKKGGTNKDGTKSKTYCSHCYNDGVFIDQDITLDEMKVIYVDKMKEMGFPRFIGKLFSMSLKNLERWKR